MYMLYDNWRHVSLIHVCMFDKVFIELPHVKLSKHM